MDNIKKLISQALLEELTSNHLSLVEQDGQLIVLPSSSLLIVQDGQVSGFLAKQILEIHDQLEVISHGQRASTDATVD